jgi:hypothetical protein
MNDSKKKPGLGMPVEVARQQLIDDSETQELAKTFGVTVEEYADLVLEYAQNPDKQPELHVIDDEEWQESGVDAATTADVRTWFQGVIDGDIDLTPEHQKINDRVSSDRQQEQSKKAAGLEAKISAPQFESMERKVVVDQETPMGSVLKDQLRNQLARSQMGRPGAKKKKPN